VQLFLSPLPSTIADRGPAGTVKVKFLPVRPGEEWDVVVGDRKLCTTPCERWVDPAMPYTLKHDPGVFQRNEYIDVPDLRQHASLERMVVRAEARDTGELVGGILLTTFGGLGIATGTALTAVGCSTDRGGLCTAGAITLPLGALLLAPGVYMIVDSKGEVHVNPMAPGAAGFGGPEGR
ncbi:MAG TPA: hypothetical protein VFS43_12425, partial [Polyangiaceae bacterium]|nr:hypothetical protein [Polyangiaceae bacterium]